MPTQARIVFPGHAHHVVQRGNRNQQTFFSDEDKQLYLHLFQESAKRYQLECLAYCLMDNHVHFVVVPATTDGLAKGFGVLHKRYTTLINRRMGWSGCLWQKRFSSFALSQRHLYAAIRYVELNPIKAMLVQHPAEYRWSSAPAHCLSKQDVILSATHTFNPDMPWSEYLQSGTPLYFSVWMELHAKSGKPIDLVAPSVSRQSVPKRSSSQTPK